MANAGDSRDYKILRALVQNQIKFPEILPDDDYEQITIKRLFALYYKAYHRKSAHSDYASNYNANLRICNKILIRINSYRLYNWYHKPITNVKWE